MVIVDNLTKVRDAVKRCNRDVVLVAATKTQTKETIDEFASLAPDFILGENRVQELVDKYDTRYVWHFIGRLQTNKVKYIIDKVALIHSLDRIELADEIEKQAKKHSKMQDCLVEVNMAGELSKGGIEPDKLFEFVDSLKNYEHLRIVGIMSVLPNLDDETELRRLYAELEKLYEQLKTVKQTNLDVKYLSAGMTNDYNIALEYGSNMIRLGRLLFGERQAIYSRKENMDERYYGSNDRADNSADRSRISRLLSRDRQDAPAPAQAYAPSPSMQTTSQGGVVIYSPSTYEDVQLLIDHLKMREQVIVDFSTLNQASVYRILDFMSGAIYALSGSIQQITTNIFLFAPAGVTITVPPQLGRKR